MREVLRDERIVSNVSKMIGRKQLVLTFLYFLYSHFLFHIREKENEKKERKRKRE